MLNIKIVLQKKYCVPNFFLLYRTTVNNVHEPTIPVVALSKAYVYDRLFAGVAGSKLAEYIDILTLCLLCFV